MEKAFKKQLAIWKKAVIKYRLTSSDAANEINDLLRRIRDSGDEDLIKRVTSKYSKSLISFGSAYTVTEILSAFG